MCRLRRRRFDKPYNAMMRDRVVRHSVVHQQSAAPHAPAARSVARDGSTQTQARFRHLVVTVFFVIVIVLALIVVVVIFRVDADLASRPWRHERRH